MMWYVKEEEEEEEQKVYVRTNGELSTAKLLVDFACSVKCI